MVEKKIPDALNRIADVVLNYRPKPTTTKAKKRKRKAKKHATSQQATSRKTERLSS